MIKAANVVKVGIADMNFVTAPDVLKTSGLGSCVAVILFTSHRQVAGMAHVMLPSSNLNHSPSLNHAKYADTAIQALLAGFKKHHIAGYMLKAKIAGGAQMFPFASQNDDGLARIGPRNVKAVRQQLEAYRIPLIAEDIGGTAGRTVVFDPATNILQVKTADKGMGEI